LSFLIVPSEKSQDKEKFLSARKISPNGKPAFKLSILYSLKALYSPNRVPVTDFSTLYLAEMVPSVENLMLQLVNRSERDLGRFEHLVFLFILGFFISVVWGSQRKHIIIHITMALIILVLTLSLIYVLVTRR
jgi:hypothetical protein